MRATFWNPAGFAASLVLLFCLLVAAPEVGFAQGGALPPGTAAGPLRDSGPPPAPGTGGSTNAPAATADQPSQGGVAAEPGPAAKGRVLILGDSLAEGLAPSLLEATAGLESVTVEKKSKPSSGLVRDDFYDWPKAVAEMVAAGDVVGAVMLIGSNDRQPLVDDAGRHDPFSEPWKAIYAGRIDEVLNILRGAGASIYWVGVPPMQSGRLSSDMAALNEMYRERVRAADGTFIDIWDAFVDADGRFSPVGPDLAGATRRLRASDGVHFTKAGNQKLAYFVEREIRRDLGGSPTMQDLLSSVPADEAITPDGATPPTAAPPVQAPVGANAPSATAPQAPVPDAPATQTAAVPAAPPVQTAPPAPLVGPVVPLTGDLGGGDDLSDNQVPAKGRSEAAERLLGRGEALPSRPGRADDFTWRQ